MSQVSTPVVSEHRPWGSFTILGDYPDCKTKRLDILPGKRSSLQSHRHRTEHWIVVEGRALITLNERVVEKKAGETVSVPCGTLHRIENPGCNMLSIIEVQLGDYFGEDDIVRYEDDFGRE